MESEQDGVTLVILLMRTMLDHTLMVSDCSGLSGAEDLHLKQGPNMVIHLVQGENLESKMNLAARKPGG